MPPYLYATVLAFAGALDYMSCTELVWHTSEHGCFMLMQLLVTDALYLLTARS